MSKRRILHITAQVALLLVFSAVLYGVVTLVEETKEQEKLITHQNKKINKLKEEKGSLQLNVLKLEETEKSLRKSLDQKSKEVRDSQEKRMELEGKLKTQKGINDTLLKKNGELQRKNDTLKNQVSSKERDNTPPLVSRGVQSSSKKVITMRATAYTAYCKGCSGTTSTGIDLRANPGTKLIAVDPSVIPLGTKVHVEGYGYAIASDKGGAIKGNRIDVFVPSERDAIAFGRKIVKVTILE
jgi:3D (Asp-Asp-Asp) domain-containing protein